MFESLSTAAPDPILGLTDAFQCDPRTDKINLTVGVYKDEHGATPILGSVKLAETRLLTEEKSKGYLGIDGLPEFNRQVVELVLGDRVDHRRVAPVQSPGGTGACRLASEMIGMHYPGTRIWISQPTWPNHPSIFQSAGMSVATYPYLDASKTCLDLGSMLDMLDSQGREGDFVCLHACCHNPTGIDPSREDWPRIASLLARKKMIPFVDFAYQGFGDGLEDDAFGLGTLLEHCPEAVVCASFSKNFGLYSERVGSALLISENEAAAKAALSQLKQTVRANYSNPPRHGGAIVATILADPLLRENWVGEVDEMRSRITAMRHQFVAGMKATGVQRDFGFLLKQKGMFSYSGLNAMQADWLRKEKGIYIVGTGRLNVAGMSSRTMPGLCQAIAECIESTTPASNLS
jgi:aspartate/tyrosine/aromatic aminotransferase